MSNRTKTEQRDEKEMTSIAPKESSRSNTAGHPHSNHLSRREALRWFGGALGGLAVGDLWGCRTQKEDGKSGNGDSKLVGGTPILTSGYIPILDCVPLIVAYEKGFFREQGVRAEKPSLIRSWPALLEAFTSKQILLTHILLPQVIFLKYARKIPVRSVAYNHTNVVAMLAANGNPSVFQLGGKVVGCPTWWAPHTGIFQDVIRAAGLRPVVGKAESQLDQDEVAFRVVPPPDMVDGLKSGRIAGCTVSEPFGAGAEVLAEAV